MRIYYHDIRGMYIFKLIIYVLLLNNISMFTQVCCLSFALLNGVLFFTCYFYWFFDYIHFAYRDDWYKWSSFNLKYFPPSGIADIFFIFQLSIYLTCNVMWWWALLNFTYKIFMLNFVWYEKNGWSTYVCYFENCCLNIFKTG